MTDKTKKCAHESCSCLARTDEKYCSQYCKDAKGVTSLECHCGHPACKGHSI